MSGPIIRHDGRMAATDNPQPKGFSKSSRSDFTGSDGQGESVHPIPVTPGSAERLVGEIRPAQLRDYNGPLYVINKTKTIISHDDGKGNVLRVEPCYHRDHITDLPIEVAKHPGFQRLWRTGRIKVTTDPDVEDLLSLGDDAPEDQGGLLDYTLDTTKNKDLTPFECMICSDQLFLSREEQEQGVPPLCQLHIDSVGLIEQVRDSNERLVWRLKETVKK